MQFDVNLNATLEVDDEDFEHLVDCYDPYEGYDADDLKEEGISKKERAEAREQAREEALDELASDLEGSNLDSIYGSAWVCSVDTPSEM